VPETQPDVVPASVDLMFEDGTSLALLRDWDFALIF
jgi:hypothetical protein